MNRIKRLWSNVSGKLSAAGVQADDLTARELCRMLQQCPVCRGEFTQHYYVHFAVTILGEDRRGRVREFFDAYEDWIWEELVKFQEFDGKRDAVVAYAIRCGALGGPGPARMAVALERSPSELYEADRLIACDVLDETSSEELDSLIPQNDWRKMNWT